MADYDYQPLDFENVLPSGGGGGGFTGTGQLGFQAQVPQMDFGYSQDTGRYTPIDFGAITQGAGRGGFQLPAGGYAELPGLQAPSPVNIPQYVPQGRTADAYTGAGFRVSNALLNQVAPGPVAAATGAPGVGAPETPKDKGFLERAQTFANQNPLLMRLLGGVGTAGLGAIMGGRGQQAATNLQKDLGKLGATQRAEGQRLVAAAQRGELTAPQQQQLEAFRAQQAQALASRGLTGGTAAQQLEGQIENMRQQLLAQNLQQGLALLQIGDQYTQQAITAGYNASQAAQDTSGRFYTAALQALGAIPSQQPAAQPQRTLS